MVFKPKMMCKIWENLKVMNSFRGEGQKNPFIKH